MKKLLLPAFIFMLTFPLFSQNQDSLIISSIYQNALTDTTSYHNLRILTSDFPDRLAGSDKSLAAVKWTEKVLQSMGLDSVWLQQCKVRRWERGEKEVGRVISKHEGKHDLAVCALGGSVATGESGITAQVVEIKDYDDLKKLGREKVKGKIVFINHSADPGLFNSFAAYGGVAGYRVRGADQAANYGAVAMIDRSATTSHDNYPHTGILHYADTLKHIPAFSVSTNDADNLSLLLKKDPALSIFLKSSCRDLPETDSYNVIGEIRGSSNTSQIIAFGGHLDCWDICQGAQDDGAGVVQTIDILRLWKSLNFHPKNTLRVVVFMDEEMEQRGAKAYAAAARPEPHLAAIEADRGGFVPTGFTIDASNDQIKKVQSWKNLLLPYGLFSLDKGGSGVDVRELKAQGAACFGLLPDSQRYFDYHHSANDSFDKVSLRELQSGTAAMGALIYLIDKYGL